MPKRVVLAYSGGLDTSVAVRWMIEKLGVEVIAVACNVGQEGTFDGLKERGLGRPVRSRRSSSTAREEYARDFLAPALAGERAVRGALSAGVGPVAAGHREAPRCGGSRSTARRRSRTVAPARETTRFASRCRPAPWRPTSRSWRPSARGA